MTDHWEQRESEPFLYLTRAEGDALRTQLAASQATVLAMREWVQHDERCVLMRYSAGRPTESGGYEQNFGATWYEAKPVDRTPPCDCGLAEVLAPPGSDAALRAIVEDGVRSGILIAVTHEVGAGERADRAAAWIATHHLDAIVSRLIGERAEGSET